MNDKIVLSRAYHTPHHAPHFKDRAEFLVIEAGILLRHDRVSRRVYIRVGILTELWYTVYGMVRVIPYTYILVASATHPFSATESRRKFTLSCFSFSPPSNEIMDRARRFWYYSNTITTQQ